MNIPSSTPLRFSPTAEWLEADGLGGFASGTVSGIRTRRYHALLLTATTPPTGRYVLVNGFDAWVETPAGSFSLSSQRYVPDVVHSDGARRLEAFEPDPWPRWCFRLEDGTCIEQELFVCHGVSVVVLTWRLVDAREDATLWVRPFFSGRDYHALHHENSAFRFEAEVRAERLRWRPYPDVPGVAALTNGEYHHQPDWYRRFQYAEERARGLDDTEDLGTPGLLRFSLSSPRRHARRTTTGEAILILAAEGPDHRVLPSTTSASKHLRTLRTAERQRRQRFPSRLHRAADAYIVRRGAGKTIVAGYPWFTDWGRDTFITLRGLCLATNRFDEARDILIAWAGAVSEGMLPNLFSDHGDTAEFNAVDASLWYIIAVHDFLQAMSAKERKVTPQDRQTLQQAIEAILSGYAAGTRYHIRCDTDGLLAAGQAGVQLTWMDAKVGDWVVTPRIGKPVEVQALWLNALKIASGFAPRWQAFFTRGFAAFQERFWNETGGYLHDVVDVDHQAGTVDPTLRPNQIFAVGGLPFPLVTGDRARRIVEAVETRLLTPLGLRSLAPGEEGYAAHYEGGVRDRDGAYHQGTVWPWLIGSFVEAWVRVRGDTRDAKREARARFLDPLLRHLDEAGLGHVSEITDAEEPHTPRGCPFQAWSMGELLRLSLIVLADK
ncbi:MAG: glycogen debranching protein [Deltaproteobacteria bacterium]|nr:glycogen debranching protein [Deltaproteobacteria bacterium]